MLHFRYGCQRAVDYGLHEVCRHRLAVSVIDASQRVSKVGAEAYSVLAEWRWPCGLLRPGCRYG